ncbi:MAG: hypothetical protein A2788_01540 [Candidatus Abawacabacteria bacterium RIFCSPHIGHO2_01_FULL_46_8]|uniref:Glycerophosphoryl diester phosphodiesterase membrane domain-containing protein n=1 Tax=Candidatus Abawacabacteria bacterium RIFCSPHIGHO2_01_FULL_46_8 TaxID=1817815 RepID=A0A1F4XK22_9BACT|nr:MAG: hypothetical protein A2788_01540 [Candidatus Abawacabacteria bacterium RIFCSPHIGHO2_01_FULL_46_8]
MSKDKQKKPSKIRGIVREAWQITAKNRVLHTFGVIAATLTLLVGLVYMLFRIEYFFPHLVPGLSFFSLENLFYYLTYYPSLTLAFLGLAAIVFLAYLTLPVWCEAALIATIARIREGQAKDYSFGRASSFGLQSFLPLFEFEALTVVFDITRSFTILLLIWRYFGPTLLWQSTPLIIFILLVIFLISIALIYSRYNIVLHHGEVFKSIIKSLTLVTFYLGETMILLALVLLIGIRTIINFVLVFAVPVGFVALLSYLVQSLALWLSLLIAIGVGLVVFIFVVRIAAALQIFVTAVWTIAFLELSSRKDHLLLEEK